MQDEIGVLRVLRYILLYRGTNDVDLEVVVPGPTKSSLRQRGREPRVTQIFRDLGVVQRENISGQTVVEISHFPVPLDLETAGGDFLLRSRLAMKDFPHPC